MQTRRTKLRTPSPPVRRKKLITIKDNENKAIEVNLIQLAREVIDIEELDNEVSSDIPQSTSSASTYYQKHFISVVDLNSEEEDSGIQICENGSWTKVTSSSLGDYYLTCGCCFEEFRFSTLIQCSEGHLFCKQCLSRYVEQTVFGDGKSLLKCMNTSGDVCDGYFTHKTIQLSMSEKVLERYSETQCIEAIRASNIQNLGTCYNCKLQAQLDDSHGNVMPCPDCNKKTCILCGNAEHGKIKCEDVETTETPETQTKQRIALEEALTAARHRMCPSCKIQVEREDGCDFMVCRCGTQFCYNCRKAINVSGHGHFCNQPRFDERQAMIEAGDKMVNQATAETIDGENGTKLSMEKVLAYID